MDDEVIGDVVDPTNLEPEAPEAPPETPEPKPAVHEPPPDHPRFTEIYGKMKEFERQLNDKDQTIEAMIDHNKSLQESMDGLYDKVSVSERPDQITDPDGYDKWILEQFERKHKKERPRQDAKPKATVNKVQEQAGIMKGIHEDFERVVSYANEFIKNDPGAKTDIAFSDNPPRALYEYGLKKKAEITNKRTDNIKQAGVEGGSTPPANSNKIVLNAQQERARLGLGVSKENYIKQLEIIQKQRGY